MAQLKEVGLKTLLKSVAMALHAAVGTCCMGSGEVNSYEDIKQHLRESIAWHLRASHRSGALVRAMMQCPDLRVSRTAAQGVPYRGVSLSDHQLVQESSAVPGRPLRGKAREDFISNAPLVSGPPFVRLAVVSPFRHLQPAEVFLFAADCSRRAGQAVPAVSWRQRGGSAVLSDFESTCRPDCKDEATGSGASA